MEAIPRIIHQTWKTREVPPHLRAWHDSIRERNPGWEVRVWSDDDNRALIAEHYSWFLPVYDGYRYPIMRADVIRPFLLYHHGGFYADLDVESVRPFEVICRGEVEPRLVASAPSREVGLVLGLESRITSRPVCGNAVMGSRAGHPFWKEVFAEFAARAGRRPWFFLPRENYILPVTGPDCIDAVYRKTRQQWDDALVLRPAALSPYGWWQRKRGAGDAIAIHHYASSWSSSWASFWIRLLRGQLSG